MVSVCMHTPTTTIRLCGGPSAISDWSMPGTPTASKITGSGTVAPSMADPMRSMTVRAMPKSDQRSCGDPSAGSITSSAPNASARRRRVGEKSAASTGPWPRPLSAAMTASPTGPQPTTRQGWPGLSPARPTACSPTASGSVRAARSVSSASGTGSSSSSWSTMCSASAPG